MHQLAENASLTLDIAICRIRTASKVGFALPMPCGSPSSEQQPAVVEVALERLGRNIRIAWLRRRMPQAQLAERIGVGRSGNLALVVAEPSGTRLQFAIAHRVGDGERRHDFVRAVESLACRVPISRPATRR